MEANDLGQDHGDRLTEHDCLRLNTTDAPTRDTESIDHGRVRVSADDGVRVEHVVAVEDDARQVLQVHLVHNTGAWWHNLEVVEGLGAPLEELEALAIALELELFVFLGGAGDTRGVHLDGVIDDEVDGAERVDLGGVATETLHGVTHCGKVHHGRHTAKIINNHSRVNNNAMMMMMMSQIKFKSRVPCRSLIVIIFLISPILLVLALLLT